MSRFFFLLTFAAKALIALEGIDQIYLINLDKRPDKLASAEAELKPYGITPRRISAYDGSCLTFEDFRAVALTCEENTAKTVWVKIPVKTGTLEYAFLNDSLLHQPIFSEWMTPGAVGCALSHIAVLEDAYRLGYETIWVMEDDIRVKQDPRILSSLIAELDTATSRQWDLLYTDPDFYGDNPQPENVIRLSHRIDIEDFPAKEQAKRLKLGSKFIEIGSRTGTYSMIIRRSGIKKILDYFAKNKLFLPIDHEIPLVPGIRLFMPRDPVLVPDLSSSDIRDIPSSEIFFESTDIGRYKQANIPQFFSSVEQKKQANRLIDFLLLKQPEICVEIDTGGESAALATALALHYTGRGHLFYIGRANPVAKTPFAKRCTLLARKPSKALAVFANESVDFLYIDGHGPKQSLEEIAGYLPKVKKGGFIGVYNAHAPSAAQIVSFLLGRTVFLQEHSDDNRYILLQKI